MCALMNMPPGTLYWLIQAVVTTEIGAPRDSGQPTADCAILVTSGPLRTFLQQCPMSAFGVKQTSRLKGAGPLLTGSELLAKPKCGQGIAI